MSTTLRNVKSKTPNQQRIFELFDAGHNLYIKGTAGTGKSFISMYLCLDELLNHQSEFNKLIIVRSTVPTRKQGFLPGDDSEKNEVFEIPYSIICNKLIADNSNGNTYKDLKNRKLIEFMSTSYLRGQTFEKALILVDEVQNFNDGEINTVMTRLGTDCQIIICGDTAQNDLQYMHEESCILRLDQTIPKMPSFRTVVMTNDDICRNPVVREWIIARSKVSNTTPQFLRERTIDYTADAPSNITPGD